MILRFFRLEDVDAVHALEQQWLGKSWTREQLIQEVHLSSSLALVAEINGGVAGYAFFRRCGPEAELLRIAVDNKQRGRKLGQSLLNKGLQSLMTQKVETCFLEVRESNHNARQLYMKTGFVQYTVRQKYYSNPVEDAILMQKKIECKQGGSSEVIAGN